MDRYWAQIEVIFCSTWWRTAFEFVEDLFLSGAATRFDGRGFSVTPLLPGSRVLEIHRAGAWR